ncbi:UDP-forming cellulose synthase catalytic subunit [Martelella lutilitoris]|uniref:Cellulose synthase catalytic subunit [UDP-forming] n=1 Tax=Martelella lutilitoris TaxID=2583532 RepID=A0A5C4JUV7_9HYPH|nr:UDP-forming cellulose synthase catalytic subunit [Martelella lutilitoris]TNB49208.1 UDP-forming cellulose synthase catalytic subunit [Martelella lutilitoris]
MRRAAIVIAWMITSIFVLGLVTLPIDLRTQIVVSVVAVAVMMVLKQMHAEGNWRLIALAFGTSIVLRYVFWRTTSTLPPITELQNFIPGVLLYCAEMFSVCMLALSLFVVSFPLPVRPRWGKLEGDLPYVDVYVPSYNEDATLLSNTLAAAKAMDYPPEKLKVYLLDDGGSEQKRNSKNLVEASLAQTRHRELRQICAELGVGYITRPRNEHAKAGNMNHALQYTTGDLIVVFDADHAPTNDFLHETVGYFMEDPKLFLVQTPHFFINPDPLERNLRTYEIMPSENEMFYGIIQRGLDKWNASFFCGSAAVLRREALNSVNGFSGVSITEDCETAVELHSNGWNSVYVDRPLIAGLQPATFSSFIGQRSRWAQGMMQILRFKFPILLRGLTLPQRLCYMSSNLFWLFPFARASFMIAPLCYLFFGLQIFDASGGEFLAYTLSYLIVNMLIQNYLFGQFRWPWISELYEYIQTIHLMPAVVSAIINPKKPSFKVTAKDESIEQSRLSEISRPFFIIFFVFVAAMVMMAYRLYAEPYLAGVTWVVGGWNFLNLFLTAAALGVVSEVGERQKARRVKMSRRCELVIGDSVYRGTIEDVSTDGAGLQVQVRDLDRLRPGTHALLRVEPHKGGDPGEVPVMIRHARSLGELAMVGCRYAPVCSLHHSVVSDLMFANSERWQQLLQSRKNDPGTLGGTFWFIKMSIRQMGRGLSYFIGKYQPNTGGVVVRGKGKS